MTTAGPSLAALVHRLAEAPAAILAEPLGRPDGIVHAEAVVCDVLLHLDAPLPPPAETRPFATAGDVPTGAWLKLVLLACWIIHDDWFAGRRALAGRARALFATGLQEPAAVVKPGLWVSDPDRREELVRLCLAALDLHPAGETAAQAADRLTALDSSERRKVALAARAAEARARAVREAMRRKAAEEAAASYGRE